MRGAVTHVLPSNRSFRLAVVREGGGETPASFAPSNGNDLPAFGRLGYLAEPEAASVGLGEGAGEANGGELTSRVQASTL